MYETTYTRAAINALKRQPATLKARVMAIVAEIAADPFAKHPQAAPLKGEKDTFRYRFGDWRLLYTIDRAARVVIVVDFKPGDVPVDVEKLR